MNDTPDQTPGATVDSDEAGEQKMRVRLDFRYRGPSAEAMMTMIVGDKEFDPLPLAKTRLYPGVRQEVLRKLFERFATDCMNLVLAAMARLDPEDVTVNLENFRIEVRDPRSNDPGPGAA